MSPEIWELGRAEMGIRREEGEKIRAYKVGNGAEDVMGSLFARERRHKVKLERPRVIEERTRSARG